MGACNGKEVDPEAAKRNKEIEKLLKGDKKKNRIKLLLLGAGESGKSTIAKQMKIIHLHGYVTDEDRLRFRPNVYVNVLDNICTLIRASEKLGIPIKEENKEIAERIMQRDASKFHENGGSDGLGEELAKDIKTLWEDPGIQETFSHSSEYQLNDSAEYFFDNLERISQKDYIPIQDDILRVRAKTTGIHEIEFEIGKYYFSMTDVGGQRSERRKWIHCFEDVTAIIFCAALSEYDQTLAEDETTNRMAEALKLFSDIANSKWFSNTPIILFLNKKDIFEKKISRIPLNKCSVFENYVGPNEPDAAAQYIEQRFIAQVKNPSKLVYPYRTVATSTDNIKFIFRAVKDVFITFYLMQLGLLGTGMSAPPTRADYVDEEAN